MKYISILFALTLASAGCSKPPGSSDKEKPIRHCVDKNKKVVDEKLCEGPQAASSGMQWLFLYALLRHGQTAQGGSYAAPVAGFSTYRQALVAPKVATPTPAPRIVEPKRSSAPMRLAPSPARVSPPRPSPARMSSPSPVRVSSPVRSSARYR